MKESTAKPSSGQGRSSEVARDGPGERNTVPRSAVITGGETRRVLQPGPLQKAAEAVERRRSLEIGANNVFVSGQESEDYGPNNWVSGREFSDNEARVVR